MAYPTQYRYTKEHEWIDVKDGVATIGITDYAQHELGDVVFVELPAVGATLDHRQNIWLHRIREGRQRNFRASHRAGHGNQLRTPQQARNREHRSSWRRMAGQNQT